MSRWGDTSSDEEHHGAGRHNDEGNQEATQGNVRAVRSIAFGWQRGSWPYYLTTVVYLGVCCR
jgi:hypothetical protein